MVSVAAISMTYLLTPTRRSRSQIQYETNSWPLRIRNRTPAVSILLIRFTWAKTTITNTYTYTYTFNLYASCRGSFVVSSTSITPASRRIYKPSKLIELYILIRSPLERRSYVVSCIDRTYIRIYILIRICILIVYNLRRLDGATLFR